MNLNKVVFPFLSSIIFSFGSFCVSAQTSTGNLKTIIVDAGHGGTDPGSTGQYENSLRSKEKDITLGISKKLVAELKRRMPDLNIVPTRTTDIYQSPREKANIANDNKGNLFICIHADSGPLKTGKRQVGTKTVTKYRITYKGKGKSRKKIKTPYKAEQAIFEYYKQPMTRSGTSVWIFAAHKTSDKLKAIMSEVGEFDVESSVDSSVNSFDFNSPEGKVLAQVYAKRYQERSDMLAQLVNNEVDKTGRQALGVNQRQTGIWVLQATNMPAVLVETGFINNPEDEKYLTSEKGQQEMAELITKAVMSYRNVVDRGFTPSAPTASTDEPAKNEPQKKEEPKAVLGSNNTNTTAAALEKRPSQILQTIGVNSDEIKVEVFDNGDIDGDIVTLLYNNGVIASNTTLSAKPLTFILKINGDRAINELVMYAHNVGKVPPNTARMVVTDGGKRYEVGLTSDSKQNGLVRFVMNKRK